MFYIAKQSLDWLQVKLTNFSHRSIANKWNVERNGNKAFIMSQLEVFKGTVGF